MYNNRSGNTAYLRSHLETLESTLDQRLELCEGLDMGLLTDEDEDEDMEDFEDGEDEMMKESKRRRVVSFFFATGEIQ